MSDKKIDLKKFSSDELVKMGSEIVTILSSRGINFFARVIKDCGNLKENLKSIRDLFDLFLSGDEEGEKKK